MKLSEIVAKLNSLSETVATFIGDKAKATTEALATFSADLQALKTGAVAELTAKTTELATANERATALNSQLETAKADLSAINTALKAACSELKLEIKEGATSADMITALKDGVSTTLAKLNVKKEDIPAGKATTSQKGESKTKSKADFDQMTPAAKMEFCKSGGKIVG